MQFHSFLDIACMHKAKNSTLTDRGTHGSGRRGVRGQERDRNHRPLHRISHRKTFPRAGDLPSQPDRHAAASHYSELCFVGRPTGRDTRSFGALSAKRRRSSSVLCVTKNCNTSALKQVQWTLLNTILVGPLGNIVLSDVMLET